MIPTPSKYIRPLAPALAAILLAACQGDSALQISSNQVAVPLPAELREVAALRASELRLQISINDEPEPLLPVTGTINSEVDADNIRTVTVEIPENQTNRIKIEWLMNVNGQNILLADFSANVAANQTTLEVDSYNFDYDADDDGLSNLQEAEENRNLLSPYDAEVPRTTIFNGATIAVLDDGRDDDLSGDVVDPVPLDTTFGLRHDGTNLIVYVCGQDNILREDSRMITEPGQQPDQFWHDDTVYIYLDGADDTKDSNYDQVDDFQLAFIRESEEFKVVRGGGNQFCPNGSCIVDYKFFNSTSNCVYEFDVRLPIADLNMTVGTPVGFDIEFTDDDNGGRRDSSRGWIGFDDKSNLDPSTFGTIILR